MGATQNLCDVSVTKASGQIRRGAPHLPRNAVIGQAQEIGPLAAPSAGRLEATAPLHCGLARIALRGLTYRGRRSRGVGQSDVARFGCTRTLGACLRHDPRTGLSRAACVSALRASNPCRKPRSNHAANAAHPKSRHQACGRWAISGSDHINRVVAAKTPLVFIQVKLRLRSHSVLSW